MTRSAHSVDAGRPPGEDRLTREPPQQYPAAMINITNRCNLRCSHCYLYSDGNPNDLDDQITDDDLLAKVERIRDRHGLQHMVWMGGEPMIRRRLLDRLVPMFAKNTIATNGTIPLSDLGPSVTYSVSLDGPEPYNDELRGAGVYARAQGVLADVPSDFSSTIQVQCVVTRQNQQSLEQLVTDFVDTTVNGVVFSFHCPDRGQQSPLAWRDAAEREAAVDAVLALKDRYQGFIWNAQRALELMRPATAKLVTDNCPAVRTVMPLYIEEGDFVTPRCCHGNMVDCDRCGAWVVFAHAAQIPGPWDELLPPDQPGNPLSELLERSCIDLCIDPHRG